MKQNKHILTKALHQLTHQKIKQIHELYAAISTANKPYYQQEIKRKVKQIKVPHLEQLLQPIIGDYEIIGTVEQRLKKMTGNRLFPQKNKQLVFWRINWYIDILQKQMAQFPVLKTNDREVELYERLCQIYYKNQKEQEKAAGRTFTDRSIWITDQIADLICLKINSLNEEMKNNGQQQSFKNIKVLINIYQQKMYQMQNNIQNILDEKTTESKDIHPNSNLNQFITLGQARTSRKNKSNAKKQQQQEQNKYKTDTIIQIRNALVYKAQELQQMKSAQLIQKYNIKTDQRGKQFTGTMPSLYDTVISKTLHSFAKAFKFNNIANIVEYLQHKQTDKQQYHQQLFQVLQDRNSRVVQNEIFKGNNIIKGNKFATEDNQQIRKKLDQTLLKFKEATHAQQVMRVNYNKILAQNKKLTVSNEQFNKKIQTKINDIQSHSNRILQYEKQIEQLKKNNISKSQIKQLQTSKDNLQKVVELQKRSYEQMEKQMIRSRSQNQKQVTNLLVKIDNLSMIAQKYQNNKQEVLEQLRLQINQKKKILSERHQLIAKLAQSQYIIKNMNVQYSNIQKQAAKKQQFIKQLQLEIQQIRRLPKSNAQVEQKIKKLTQQLRISNQKLVKMQEYNIKRQQKIKDNQSRANAMIQKVKELEKHIENSNKQILQLKAKQKSTINIDEKFSFLIQQIADLKKQNEKITNKIEINFAERILSKQSQEANSFSKKVSNNLQKKVQGPNLIKQDLQCEIQNLEQKLSNLKHQILTEKQLLSSVSQQLKSQKNQLQYTKQKNREANKRNQKYNEEYEELINKLNKVKTEYEQMLKKTRELRKVKNQQNS